MEDADAVELGRVEDEEEDGEDRLQEGKGRIRICL